MGGGARPVPVRRLCAGTRDPLPDNATGSAAFRRTIQSRHPATCSSGWRRRAIETGRPPRQLVQVPVVANAPSRQPGKPQDGTLSSSKPSSQPYPVNAGRVALGGPPALADPLAGGHRPFAHMIGRCHGAGPHGRDKARRAFYTPSVPAKPQPAPVIRDQKKAGTPLALTNQGVRFGKEKKEPTPTG